MLPRNVPNRAMAGLKVKWSTWNGRMSAGDDKRLNKKTNKRSKQARAKETLSVGTTTNLWVCFACTSTAALGK